MSHAASQLTQIKRQGMALFFLGIVLALLGAAKLAPPVYQANLQRIGGGYTEALAEQLASRFLLSASAVHPEEWRLHLHAKERLRQLRPPLSWLSPLSAKEAEQLMPRIQGLLLTSLESYQPPAPFVQTNKKGEKKQTSAKEKKTQKHASPPKLSEKEQAKRRKKALLGHLRDAIAGEIFAALQMGQAGEISPAAKLHRKKHPAPSWGWADTLPLFLLGSLLAFSGLFLWRRGGHYERIHRLTTQKEAGSSPLLSLAPILPALDELREEWETLGAASICQRIDLLLASWVLPFVESRGVLLETLGMRHGADVLVIVAFAERMLNRVWSAASDDHLPEARLALLDAIAAFQEAQEKLAAFQLPKA